MRIADSLADRSHVSASYRGRFLCCVAIESFSPYRDDDTRA